MITIIRQVILLRWKKFCINMFDISLVKSNFWGVSQFLCYKSNRGHGYSINERFDDYFVKKLNR